jgi:archaellum component FlaC
MKNKENTKPFALSKNAEKSLTIMGFGVILEEFREIFKGLGEGQKILFEQMGRMEGRMDGMEGRMGRMEGRMDGMEGKMDSVETEMRDGFKTVMEYLSRIDTELQEIKAELSQKAQIKEVRELQNRVLKLELELIAIRNSLHVQKT